MKSKMDPKNVVAELLRNSNSQIVKLALVSIDSFVKEVFRSISFKDKRPSIINRNWILHGRDIPEWKRVDCIRLFQAIDTFAIIT